MIDKLIPELDKDNELSELIDILNEAIILESKSIKVLEKSVINTLVTKLETFLERKTSDWFEHLKEDKLCNASNLSPIIKKEIIKDTIDIVYEELKQGAISNKHKNKLKNFNILVEEFYPLKNLDIDFKLTLNSHGSTEIKKLLKKIGIEDIFKMIDKYVEEKELEEILGNITISTKFDYEGNINKLVNYRNSIIHEDTLPSISYMDLNEFIKSVNALGNVVIKYVDNIYEKK